jgi:hypothetical protein
VTASKAASPKALAAGSKPVAKAAAKSAASLSPKAAAKAITIPKLGFVDPGPLTSKAGDAAAGKKPEGQPTTGNRFTVEVIGWGGKVTETLGSYATYKEAQKAEMDWSRRNPTSLKLTRVRESPDAGLAKKSADKAGLTVNEKAPEGAAKYEGPGGQLRRQGAEDARKPRG